MLTDARLPALYEAHVPNGVRLAALITTDAHLAKDVAQTALPGGTGSGIPGRT